ncbi:hypothetical protein T484DRAFT_3407972 [Baffinella frigidus]|nr:hypothetical protein T484DRAFT_3407972 [Cryptophyta sp. CCMP2293]
MIKLVSSLAAGDEFDPAGNEAAQLLHYAAKYGHSELISFLVHQGTDLGGRNSNGVSAMHIAAKHGHIPVVQLLMSNGMEVSNVLGAGRETLNPSFSHAHLLDGRVSEIPTCDLAWC